MVPLVADSQSLVTLTWQCSQPHSQDGMLFRPRTSGAQAGDMVPGRSRWAEGACAPVGRHLTVADDRRSGNLY